MDQENGNDLSPSPSRLVESLRDTGYSHQAAFADIVDNSVAAGASIVKIDIFESVMGDEIFVSFYDNGSGMNNKDLINAMRYGSEKRASPKSLGKFGMGLKTASTAFCKNLTVISMKDGELNVCCWDIDHIKETNKWQLYDVQIEDYGSETDALHELAGAGNGTAVIWRKIDRLVANSGTEYSAGALDTIITEVSEHLSATFGKFMKKGKDGGGVELYLNDTLLDPWDPTGIFLNTAEEPDRVLSQTKKVPINLKTGLETSLVEFELNGFVLPNSDNMTEEEKKQVRYSNDNQGFYIYREDRLIFSGGYPHIMYSQDSHQNLLRVELNFDHRLDDYFEIDIRKSKINLPPTLRSEIKKIMTPWRNQSMSRYRKNSKPTNSGGTTASTGGPSASNGTHSGSSIAIGKHQQGITGTELISLDSENQIIRIKNRFGEITLNRAALVEGTDIFVSTTDGDPADPLWLVDFNDDGKPIVILNSNHEFYQRFYHSSEISHVLIQAMDTLLWSCAHAEVSSISDKVRKNYEEFRMSVSGSLRKLAKELPDVEE